MGTIDVNIIAKNITGSEVFIHDLGISIAASSQRDLTSEFTNDEIASSDNLKSSVESGSIVFYNGTRDLTTEESLDFFNEIIGLEVTETFAASADLTHVLARGNSAGSYSINMNGNRITNVASPQDTNDVATRGYVNTLVASGSAALNSTSHEVLDTLVHNLSEPRYIEYIRINNRVTSIVTWTTPSKTLKIREETYTYTNGVVTQIINKQFDGNGIVIKTETNNISRINGQVSIENIGVT